MREVAREADDRWGLGPRELGAVLAELPRVTRPVDAVLVIECRESQSTDLARQLSDRWRVTARPWSLERAGEPPEDAVLVGTYFHYNDVRVRWPRRFPHVRFVATRPDPAIRERLEHLRGDGDGPVPVVLWERDEAMGRNIAADLLRTLPEEKYSVRHRVGRPGAVPQSSPGTVLFSPRTWAELPEEARCRREFVEVRYVFEPGDLERVARELGWVEGAALQDALALQVLAERYLDGTVEWERYEAALRQALAGPGAPVARGFPQTADAWQWSFFRGVMHFDPIPYWRQVRQPVLVLLGEADRNAPSIRSAYRLLRLWQEMGHPDATLRVIPGAGHPLWEPEPDNAHRPSLHPDVVAVLREWLAER